MGKGLELLVLGDNLKSRWLDEKNRHSPGTQGEVGNHHASPFSSLLSFQ